MEARQTSECGVISSWSLFKNVETGARHLIGYSPNFKFDIISEELAVFEFYRETESGVAITKKGIRYLLSGKPMRINLKRHPLVEEFKIANDCKVRPVKVR